MPPKVCLEVGCNGRARPGGSRCDQHELARQRARNAARGDRYGPQHRASRREWEPTVAAGMTSCARCAFPILPGEVWHLDHLDDGVSRPSHARCNESARRNVG